VVRDLSPEVLEDLEATVARPAGKNGEALWDA